MSTTRHPDPQSAVLVALYRSTEGAMTVREISKATGVSQSSIASNLEVMASDRYFPLVEKLGESASGARCWGLTSHGKDSARIRKQRMMHLRSTRRPA